MNLAYRDLRHHLGRFVLTSVGLALLLGVVMSMVGVYRGLVDDAITVVRAPAADLWVVQGGTRGPFAESSRIPRDARKSVARLAGVAETGVVTYQATQAAHGGRAVRLYVIGYELGRLGGPAAIVEGRGIGRSHFEIVVDRRAGIPVGQRITLGSNQFTVVGHTARQVDSGGNPVAWMTLRDAQKLQFELEGAAARNQALRGGSAASDQVNAVVARVHPGHDPAGVARTAERWKHFAALTQDEQESLLLGAVVDKARKQIGLFTAILLTVSTVIVALIIHTMTMEKVREIATLKLIGAPDRTIVALIVQQALALGATSFVLGATLIVSVADNFPRRVAILPADVAALGGIVLVVCVIASLLGVRYAVRIDPAQALGG